MVHKSEMASVVDTVPALQGDNSNIVTNESMLHKMNDDEFKILIPTFIYLALLSLIGIIGNSLVCHVYWTRYRLSNSQYFILCLSAIDLLSCCIAIPLEIATAVDQYTFEYTWLCKLSRFFNTLGTFSQSFLLLFIAIDRYRKICRPFGWQIKLSVAKFLCVLSVVLALFFSLTAIFMYGKQTFEISEFGLTGTHCSINDAMLNTIFPLISSAISGGCFMVGTVSMCTMYCFILRKVKRHAKKVSKKLPVLNTSATIDGRGSIINGELDSKVCANFRYGITRIKRESKEKSYPKRRSRKADSESSCTDRTDFELSCSMDCRVNDTGNVLINKGNENDETVQSDNGIKADQTNQADNLECCEKESVNRTLNDTDLGNADCERVNFDARGIQNTCSVNVELQNKMDNFVRVNEDEHSVDQTPVAKTKRNLKQTIVKTNRQISELSRSSESMTPKSIRARMSAYVRRMTSHVSSTITGSTAIETHYFKHARVRKTSFLLFLISVTFILSYMPHLLLVIIRQLVNNFVENMTNDGRAVYRFFLRSYFLNCATNPVIYGIYDSSFRTACKEIFFRCCRRRKSRAFN